jgi:TonB family protein
MIVSLSPPVYPPIARTAYIYGDVNLLLHVKEDGKVDSAAVVSGPPLLRAAAQESAQKSKFKYVGCGEAGGSYSVTYTFQLVETGACASNAPPDADCQLKVQHAPNVIQSRNHLTIVAEAICTCDPAIVVVKKVRSRKRLYLWRCGTKF